MTRILGTPSCLLKLGRRMAADERGITAVITALGIVVLMGFAGLGVDVAKWLSSTRAIQAAADQAAYSAASAAGTTFCPNDASTMQAKAVAAARGFVNGQDDTTVSVTCPSTESFKVTITQGQPMWFTRLFLETAPSATRSAAARVAGKKTDLCILAIDGTNPSEAHVGADANVLAVQGSATVNVDCGVAVDSSSDYSLQAGSNAASLTATDVYLVGDMLPQSSGFTPNITVTGCSSCDPVIPPNQIDKHQRAVSDPYANRTVPAHSCSTTAGVTYSGTSLTTTIPGAVSGGSGVGIFCGGLNITGTNVTVGCGTYIIAGGQLAIDSNSKVVQSTGCTTGVTFILTNSAPGVNDYARVNYQGNNAGKLILTAPSSGPYGGLVFFQDRNAPAPTSSDIDNSTSCGGGSKQNKFSGQAQIALTGALYFPSQTLCYAGGSSSDANNKCTQIIAYNIIFTGSPSIKSQCDGVGIANMTVPVPTLIQ
jgi:Putative Flp pilus-assembly TadE/G-like